MLKRKVRVEILTGTVSRMRIITNYRRRALK